MDDAETLHQEAIAAGNANNYVQARELVDRARDRTDDPDLLDRLDVTASRLAFETGSPAEAIALCERVLARERVLPLTAGLAHSQLGMLHTQNADLPSAAQSFATALTMLDGEPLHLGRAYLNRGIMHLQFGDAAAATQDFASAVEKLEQADDPVDLAKAIFNLAYAALLRNDLVAAIKGMDQAADTLASLSPVNQAIVQQDRAEVLVASGRTREAAQALETAAAAYGGEGLRRYQAECELLLARTLLSDDPALARKVARAAARRFRSHGSDTWALRADAMAAVAEIEAGSVSKSLLTVCDDVGVQLRKSGHRLDADRLALHAARLAVRKEQFEDASARIAKVRLTPDCAITTRILAREVRSELAAAENQPARTRMYARKGLSELHSWQATFGSLDLHSSTVGHGQHLARLGLRAALDDGSPEVVFEWSERARALASRVTSLRPPPDPALAADLTELRLADPKDIAKARQLKERIRSHSWFAAAGTVGEPAGLKDLQKVLAEQDAALVAHIVLDDRITAFAVTGADTALADLGEAAPVRALLDRVAADLDFAAQHREGDLASAVRGSLRADLATIADKLVRPLLGTIGYRRLVLTPSALLAGTPWSCLPGLIGRPLTIPTSATRWLEQAGSPAPRPAVAGFVAGPRVARAEEEVHRAAAAWPAAQVLAGDEADAARVGWLASRVDLFHVAGHGLHPGDHPLFSAVELADGPWFGHDVDLLPRTPELVVLSACDLGRVSVLHGEESVGMSAAWLHAGARTVISSPALIADELACEVFAAWHQLVADGSAPADALAQVCAQTDDVVPLLSFGAGW